MEPASTPAPPPAEPNQYPAPSPYAADPQAPAEIGPPGPYAQPGPPAPRAPGEARIGVIVLTALVLELLLIGIGANQWVTDRLLRATPGSRMEQLIQFSWLTFNWRFSPRAHDTQHWLAQTLLVVTVLVLTAALIVALLRGPVTWARAFFGTWLAVVFATICGAIVRGLIDPYAKFGAPGLNRVSRALFSPSGPSQTVVVGGLGLGLIVALLTSLVAVASRRDPARARATVDAGPPSFADYGPPPASAPPSLPPWQDQHFGPPVGPSLQKDEPQRYPAQYQPGSPDSEPTQYQPPPDQPRAGSEPTARFPRPPDDEDLGHVEH